MREYTVKGYDYPEDYDNGKAALDSKAIIARLECISRGWIPDYNFTGTEDDYESYLNHMAIYKAIEIIERQEG